MTKSHRSSILCPNCKKLISANEARCPHCGMANPGSWWKNLKLWELLSTDQIIWAIIYVNIGMYIFSLLLNPISSGLSLNPFALLSPGDKSLLLLGATGTVPIDRLHRWWTLIAANYLHGGIFHILFNMIAFRQLGPFVLREYGAYRMFVIYTLSGVLGFFISYLAGVSFTIGASASVCGLIGATLYYSKSRGGIYGQALFRQIGGWAISIFIFGLLMPGINNWGHGGGILFGIILGYLLGYQDRVKEGLLHSILAGMCGLITVLVLAWAIFSSLYYRVAG
jgi:rhomboid protease GluP